MTPKQTRWASQHDWFIESVKLDNGSYSVIVRGDVDDVADELGFTDFQQLKEWAGY